MADVFISYAKEDHVIAMELAYFLEASGYSTWHDVELRSGDDYQIRIAKIIANAYAITPDESPYAPAYRCVDVVQIDHQVWKIPHAAHPGKAQASKDRRSTLILLAEKIAESAPLSKLDNLLTQCHQVEP
jgi:TIR domain